MRRSLVLFDIDGTLVDTDGAGRRAIGRACRETFGIEAVDARTIGVRFAGMTDPVILAAVARATGIDPDRLERERSALLERYFAVLSEELQRPNGRRRTMPGVVPLLERLHGLDGVDLGLVTGNFETSARIKLEAFGLNRFFPGGGFSSDHADRTEIARIAWRRLCDRTGCEFAPAQVSVVGDTEHDVFCARRNGFRSVAVVSGWVAREDLERAGPDRLLDDLTDLGLVLEALNLPETPGRDSS